MAVPEQTPYKEYTANGNTTSFALGFICDSKNDLIVLVDNVAPPVATWSLVGNNAVFTTAPASGKKIILQRNTAMSRTTNYQSNNNSFRPETINKDIDRVWLKLQELGVADMLLKIYVDRLHGEQKDYIDNKDQLVRNIITDLRNYVNQQDGSLSSDISDLLTHVDHQDNTLRNHFNNVINQQGISLLQLDSYYNYLMQRIAQIAVDKGWDASLVVDGDKTQNQINYFNGLYTFNTLNVLDYIPRSQHALILNGAVALQDESAIKAGFDAWCAVARTRVAPKCLIPAGKYAVNDTVIMDFPNHTQLDWLGEIVSNTLGVPAVVIGSTTINRFYQNIKGGYVTHKKGYANVTDDKEKKSVGILYLNLVVSNISYDNVSGFYSGVVCDASKSNGGFSYNKTTCGFTKDNVKGILLRASGDGYTNENIFYGGSFGHAASFPFTGDEVDITVEHHQKKILNNNRFICPSLESHNVETRAAFIDGVNTLIFHPRLENSQSYINYFIEFGPNSRECELLGNGFGQIGTVIIDNGKNNCYETRSTKRISKQTAANQALLSLHSSASNNAKLISLENTAKTETFSILATGELRSSGFGYFSTGLRWSTTSGELSDRGLFIGTTDPEGSLAARPGSIHFNTLNGVTKIKRIGTSDSGWRQLAEVFSGVTSSRPVTGIIAGTEYFDTTLNKPIWYNGTVWVDATGATV